MNWVRDVTMKEDARQVRVGNLPQVMAIFRNATLSVIRCAGYSNVAAARRYYASNPRQALKGIGCKITE